MVRRARHLNPVVGTALALIAAWLFAGMALCVRRTEPTLNTTAAVFLRTLTGTIFLSPFAYRKIRLLWSANAKTLWLRAFAGSGSSFFFFWNLQQSTVGDATALANLTPVFVAIFSRVLLGEILSPLKLAGISVSMAGMFSVGISSDSHMTGAVLAMGLVGAIFSAVALTALRHVAVRYSTMLVVWTYMGSGVILATVLGGAPLFHTLAAALTSHDGLVALCWGILGGICGLFAQLLLTVSFFSLEAAVATTLSLTSILWGSLLEIVFLDRAVSVGTWCAYGLVIIGAFILQISVSQGLRRLARATPRMVGEA